MLAGAAWEIREHLGALTISEAKNRERQNVEKTHPHRNKRGHKYSWTVLLMLSHLSVLNL